MQMTLNYTFHHDQMKTLTYLTCKLTECLKDIKCRMTCNFLLLTEVLLIGPKIYPLTVQP